MTDQELKDLVASLAISQAKTDEQIRIIQERADQRQAKVDEQMKNTDEKIRVIQEKADQRQAKVDEQMAKTDEKIEKLREQQAKTDEQMKNTDEKMKKTGEKLDKVISGLENTERFIRNSAEIVEDNFYRALENSDMIIDNIHYDEIAKDLKGRTKKCEGQYDIVLFNSKHVFIIEVKHKPHVNDLPQLKKQKETFPKIFRDYKDFHIHLGLAGEGMYQELFEEAKKEGIYLLQTQADELQITAP